MKAEVFMVVSLAVPLILGAAFFATPCTAQMALGNVTLVGNVPCPSGRNFDSGMTCYQAAVTCPSTEPITLYYGVENPSGQAAGTIVMLSGDGGEELPNTFGYYVQKYVGAQYQVIEVAWGETVTDPLQSWEYTNTPAYPGTGYPYSILNAACRPATFLNWVRNGNYGSPVGSGIWAGSDGSTAGMCVHGNSGGAGGVGYALAWYSGGVGGAPQWGQGYIDKAVLENGPVFSDIQQGCEITNGVNSQTTYICAHSSTELGCGSTWNQGNQAIDYSLEFVIGDQNWVGTWSQDPNHPLCTQTPSCGASSGTSCNAQNQSWYNMSIVNFPPIGQPTPSFTYGSTAMSGWLCENVTGTPPENNSAPQGQLFFNQFQLTTQIVNLSVNAIQNCPRSEAVEGGMIYYNGKSYGGQNEPPASQALVDDMTAGQFSCKQLGQKRMGGN